MEACIERQAVAAIAQIVATMTRLVWGEERRTVTSMQGRCA
jgi:hypothetical protein